MNTSTTSHCRLLRDEAAKWLAVGPGTTFHVLVRGRGRDGRHRYVWIEARHPGGAHALFFFRHDDGRWRVLPPDARQPVRTGAYIA